MIHYEKNNFKTDKAMRNTPNSRNNTLKTLGEYIWLAPLLFLVLSCNSTDPLYEDLKIHVPGWKNLHTEIQDSTTQRLKDQSQRDTLSIDWNNPETQAIIRWITLKLNAEYFEQYKQGIKSDSNFTLTIPGYKIWWHLSRIRFTIVSRYNDQLKYNITLHNAIYPDGKVDSATYKEIEEARKSNPCYYPTPIEIGKRDSKDMQNQQQQAQKVINKALWKKTATHNPRNNTDKDRTPKW